MRRFLQASALTLVIVALWLGIQVSRSSSDKPESEGESQNRGAVSTREGSVGKVIEPQNPASYVQRIEAGLSRTQVGWIVRDFQSLALDVDLGAALVTEYPKLRKRRNEWYLNALSEGLGLDANQRAQAKASLERIFDEDVMVFHRKISETGSRVEIDGKTHVIMSGDLISRLNDASRWLDNEENAPWNLCRLTPDQLAITWNDQLREYFSYSDGLLAGQSEDWQTFKGSMKFFNEDGSTTFGDFSTGGAPSLVLEGTSVFPAISSQEYDGADKTGDPSADRSPGDDLLRQVMNLHPAQLKMLLLIRPDKAEAIRKSLEQPE